jgi:hypothetical protein
VAATFAKNETDCLCSTVSHILLYSYFLLHFVSVCFLFSLNRFKGCLYNERQKEMISDCYIFLVQVSNMLMKSLPL